MSDIDTGGPAFPLVYVVPPENVLYVYQGMTLRDYFAAQAMKYMGLPTMVYSTGRIGDNLWELKDMESFPYDDMSKVAYKWADAMLKARTQ